MKTKPRGPCAVLEQLFLVSAAVAVIFALPVPGAYAADVDEDGLSDDLEQFLINTNRPLLKYDSSEQYWPSSVKWKVRHSDLIYEDEGNVVCTSNQLNANPLLILSGNYNDTSSSTAINPVAISDYKLNLYNDFRCGSWPLGQESLAVGMYARVVPLRNAVQCANYPDLSAVVHAGDVLIQYYQFFPFNDFAVIAGETADHEGDWLFLDVFVSTNPPYAQKAIVYHHHGDSECEGPTCLTGSALPTDGVPVCYLENGSHEWWPWASSGGECQFYWKGIGPFPNGSHDGNFRGGPVRAENVLNIGEHFAPMNNEEAQMIVFYNGKWGYAPGWSEGNPAEGPLSLGRCYSVQAPRVVAYVRHSEPPRLPFLPYFATRYYPARTVAEGWYAVEDGGRVRIAAGTYPERMTISKAMTLEAWGDGPVTIGP